MLNIVELFHNYKICHQKKLIKRSNVLKSKIMLWLFNILDVF